MTISEATTKYPVASERDYWYSKLLEHKTIFIPLPSGKSPENHLRNIRHKLQYDMGENNNAEGFHTRFHMGACGAIVTLGQKRTKYAQMWYDAKGNDDFLAGDSVLFEVPEGLSQTRFRKQLSDGFGRIEEAVFSVKSVAEGGDRSVEVRVL